MVETNLDPNKNPDKMRRARRLENFTALMFCPISQNIFVQVIQTVVTISLSFHFPLWIPSKLNTQFSSINLCDKWSSKFIFFSLHIIYMHFAWIELSGTFPKLISMVASAHSHTESHLKDLREKSSLDDRPRWALCVYSMVRNLKNQSSRYLLRALLLALRSKQCRAALVCGCPLIGAMQASIKSRWREAQSI